MNEEVSIQDFTEVKVNQTHMQNDIIEIKDTLREMSTNVNKFIETVNSNTQSQLKENAYRELLEKRIETLEKKLEKQEEDNNVNIPSIIKKTAIGILIAVAGAIIFATTGIKLG